MDESDHNKCVVVPVHYKNLQHILYCFTYSERLFPQFTVNYRYFSTFISVKYCNFYSVECKMSRYTVKNIVKYRDLFKPSSTGIHSAHKIL